MTDNKRGAKKTFDDLDLVVGNNFRVFVTHIYCRFYGGATPLYRLRKHTKALGQSEKHHVALQQQQMQQIGASSLVLK